MAGNAVFYAWGREILATLLYFKPNIIVSFLTSQVRSLWYYLLLGFKSPSPTYSICAAKCWNFVGTTISSISKRKLDLKLSSKIVRTTLISAAIGEKTISNQYQCQMQLQFNSNLDSISALLKRLRKTCHVCKFAIAQRCTQRCSRVSALSEPAIQLWALFI